MKTSCIVNNYNYARFVGEALGSALEQTVPFDEVIVVDDGSTDGSLKVIRRLASGHESVRVLAKQNEGQLSCFNAGLAAATGELVFFLDADDLYESDYLACALERYGNHPEIDFLISGYREFGAVDRVREDESGNRDLGYSVIYTLYRRKWIGGPTSCLSSRRRVLERFLPVPYLDDWRTRADDCLVFGASLVGARKYRLGRPLVRYRIHDANLFARGGYDKFADYRRKLAINRLFEHVLKRTGYDEDRLGEFVHREFRTIERPTAEQWRHYTLMALRARVPWSKRLGMAASIAGYFVGGAGRTSPSRLAPYADGVTDGRP